MPDNDPPNRQQNLSIRSPGREPKVGRKVQKKTLLNLGANFAIPKAQWAELVEIIEAKLAGNEFLFEPAPELTATAELDFVH